MLKIQDPRTANVQIVAQFNFFITIAVPLSYLTNEYTFIQTRRQNPKIMYFKEKYNE